MQGTTTCGAGGLYPIEAWGLTVLYNKACEHPEHLLDRADAGGQTEPLEGPIHILPSRLEAGHERKRWGRGSAGHGVALLCGFVTPSLTAQGGQRLPP